MNLDLDERELQHLIDEYQRLGIDQSYFYHLANHLIEELQKQYPEMWDKNEYPFN